MIGRTSAKLREPANAAPSWAVGPRNDQPGEQRLSANTGGSLGVTLPITLAANCLAFHGSPDTIDPVVTAARAAKYPKDQATGFKERDIRGGSGSRLRLQPDENASLSSTNVDTAK